MDQQTAIFILIYGIICFGFGFYLRPRFDLFIDNLRAYLSKLFGHKTVSTKERQTKPITPAEDLVIKVLGKYPIDGFEFTVIEKPPIDDYVRDAYNPGTTTRLHGQWSPREQVLMRDSLVEVTIRDGKIRGGQWKCPYTGNVYIDPADVDIDHIVPLADAWISGAKNWKQLQRSAFSRDLENLIAVSQSANQQKGMKSPDKWLPPINNPETHLWYIQRWLFTKKKYDLGMTVAEIKSMVPFALSSDA